ncbi:MAG: hydantoinase/oxoprolinase family protein [Candidatus Rokubacteria bacterium]|nr:hydantoinase/oxoprolinase family protein [Candidatus Rokubacteria bacterium]
MSSSGRRRQKLCYTDTGGTFTDTFVVDEDGDFLVAKASTTPDDVASGYFDSLEDAARELGISLDDLCGELTVIGYGTTIVLNTLLTRGGVRLGGIVTKGFEQVLMIERGRQTWEEHDLEDRIHYRVHRHTTPLIPLDRMKGVTERVDCLGSERVPLYEHEVRRAGDELIAAGVEAIVICFLFSWQNPSHERRAAELIRGLAAERGVQIPVYSSVDVSPVLRELSRLNATVIEAYTSPCFRAALGRIEERLATGGFRGALQVMQSSGGLAAGRDIKAVETVQSGPVGGLIGGQYIGHLYGFDNVITTDVGGTSFDVGLVNGGRITVDREPVCSGMVLGVPVAQVSSIGAGGGTIAWVDPLTRRLQVGPDSAGAKPGPACYDRGGENPTVSDADVALGYLDPDYFLGGRIKLSAERAWRAIEERVGRPLGISVPEAATGIKRLVDVKMRDALLGMVMAHGGEVSRYHLLAFGGAGPTHAAGYTSGVPLGGVLALPFSAAFSAFGAAAADYEHHYIRAVNVVVPPTAVAHVKLDLGTRINQVWEELEAQASQQLRREGFVAGQIRFRRLAMVRYSRQLDDLIITSPVSRISTVQEWDALITAFETDYERIYASAAKYTRAGYDIFEVGLVAAVEKTKPKLRRYARRSNSSASPKGRRHCWFDATRVDTQVYEWGEQSPGAVVNGPAIIENSSTTLVVPPDRRVEIDEHLNAWLR